jgi:hypothetical protein
LSAKDKEKIKEKIGEAIGLEMAAEKTKNILKCPVSP